MASSRARRGRVAALLLLSLPVGCEARDDGGGEAGQGKTPEAAVAAEDGPEQAGHRRMLGVLARLAEESSNHPYLGEATARDLRAAKETLHAASSPVQRWRVQAQLGDAELVLGNSETAIEHLLAAYDVLPELERRMPPSARAQSVFRLGVAYLRLAEDRNCCARYSPESCILPIRGTGVHTDTEPSRQAVRYFREVLAATRPTDSLHLKARWLLNVAAMTLGRHPDGVPPPYRIDLAVDPTRGRFPRFPNVAADLGIDIFDLSGGLILEDFDGDDRIDLLTSTWDVRGGPHFFSNRGDGTFEDRTAQSNLEGMLGGLNMIQADYDDDGDVDVLLLRGAWLGRLGRHPNSLWRNDGRGRFTDVTFTAGLGEVRYPTQNADWADVDNDGDLDLFIGNESQGADFAPSQLFRNEGDGTFVDVAVAAGVQNHRFAKACSFGDYDADGWTDLYVSNLGAENRLYRNLGDGTFEDVAPRLGVTGPRGSFPAWFWDFDNDGHLDLYVATYSEEIGFEVAHRLGIEFGGERACLYRGDGEGGFVDVAREMGVDRPHTVMGSNFGDVDGDGWLDMYLGTGYPNYEALVPSTMYRNRGGRGFEDVTVPGGFGNLQKGHGVAFGDFDFDGDVDVFEQMGGAFRGDRSRNALYENPGFGNRWITLELLRVDGNRDAVGAHLEIVVREGESTRSIHRTVGTGGSFGANPLHPLIGLGRAEVVESVAVRWPGSGLRQVFTGLELDRRHRLVEGAGAPEVLPDLRRMADDGG